MRARLAMVRTAAALAVVTAEALAQERQAAGRRIVVSIPDRKLALVENGHVLKIYEVAVGTAKSPTPSGAFTVVERLEHPTWYSPGKVVKPGPANPLGTRWLGLSRKGYGIHGTNSPRSIGHKASHGCIRMRNADVEELFTRVAVGIVVELVAERSPELEGIFGAPAQVSSAQPAAAPQAEARAALLVAVPGQ